MKTFEVIIFDDGSSDKSVEIALSFSERDSRFHVYKNDFNSGVSKTANRCIENARGQYIARLDSDDTFEPNKLALQYEFFQQNPEYVLFGGAVRIVDNAKGVERIKYSPKTNKEILSKIFTFVPLQHSSVMYNRNLIPDDYQWYDPNINIGEDLDLTFRLSKFGLMANTDEILATIYERSNSLSHEDVKKTFSHIYRVRMKAINSYGILPSLQSKITMKLQSIVMSVLPVQYVFPVYYAIRKYI